MSFLDEPNISDIDGPNKRIVDFGDFPGKKKSKIISNSDREDNNGTSFDNEATEIMDVEDYYKLAGNNASLPEMFKKPFTQSKKRKSEDSIYNEHVSQASDKNQYLISADNVRSLWLEDHPASNFLKSLAGCLQLPNHESLLDFTKFDAMKTKMKEYIRGKTSKHEKEKIKSSLITKIKNLNSLSHRIKKTKLQTQDMLYSLEIFAVTKNFLIDCEWFRTKIKDNKQPILGENITKNDQKNISSKKTKKSNKKIAKNKNKDSDEGSSQENFSGYSVDTNANTDSDARLFSLSAMDPKIFGSDELDENEENFESLNWTNQIKKYDNNEYNDVRGKDKLNPLFVTIYMAMHPFIFPNSLGYPVINTKKNTKIDGKNNILDDDNYRRENIFIEYYNTIGVMNDSEIHEKNGIYEKVVVPKIVNPVFSPLFYRSKIFFKIIFGINTISIRLKLIFIFNALLQLLNVFSNWDIIDINNSDILLIHIGFCLVIVAKYIDKINAVLKNEGVSFIPNKINDFDISVTKSSKEDTIIKSVLSIYNKNSAKYENVGTDEFSKSIQKYAHVKIAIENYDKLTDYFFKCTKDLIDKISKKGIFDIFLDDEVNEGSASPIINKNTTTEFLIVNHMCGTLFPYLEYDFFSKIVDHLSGKFNLVPPDSRQMMADYDYLRKTIITTYEENIQNNKINENDEEGISRTFGVNIFGSNTTNDIFLITLPSEDINIDPVKFDSDNTKYSEVNHKFLWYLKIDRLIMIRLPFIMLKILENTQKKTGEIEHLWKYRTGLPTSTSQNSSRLYFDENLKEENLADIIEEILNSIGGFAKYKEILSSDFWNVVYFNDLENLFSIQEGTTLTFQENQNTQNKVQETIKSILSKKKDTLTNLTKYIYGSQKRESTYYIDSAKQFENGGYSFDRIRSYIFSQTNNLISRMIQQCNFSQDFLSDETLKTLGNTVFTNLAKFFSKKFRLPDHLNAKPRLPLDYILETINKISDHVYDEETNDNHTISYSTKKTFDEKNLDNTEPFSPNRKRRRVDKSKQQKGNKKSLDLCEYRSFAEKYVWYSEIYLLYGARISNNKDMGGLIEKNFKPDDFDVTSPEVVFVAEIIDKYIQKNVETLDQYHELSKKAILESEKIYNSLDCLFHYFSKKLSDKMDGIKKSVTTLIKSNILSNDDRHELARHFESLDKKIDSDEYQNETEQMDIIIEEQRLQEMDESVQNIEIQNNFFAILTRPTEIWKNVAKKLNSARNFTQIQNFSSEFENFLPVKINNQILSAIYSATEMINDYYKSHEYVRLQYEDFQMNFGTYDKARNVVINNYKMCTKQETGGPHLFLYASEMRVLSIFANIVFGEINKKSRIRSTSGPYVPTKTMSWNVRSVSDNLERLTSFEMSNDNMFDVIDVWNYDVGMLTSKKSKRIQNGKITINAYEDSEDEDDDSGDETYEYSESSKSSIFYSKKLDKKQDLNSTLYGVLSEETMTNNEMKLNDTVTENDRIVLLHAATFKQI